MTVTNKVLIASKFMEDAQTTQYTATGVTATIDAFVVINNSAGAAIFSVNLVTSGGSAGSDNRFIDSKLLQAGETYFCPEVVGQILQDGDFVSTLADSATSLVCRMSGREIS